MKQHARTRRIFIYFFPFDVDGLEIRHRGPFNEEAGCRKKKKTCGKHVKKRAEGRVEEEINR